MRSCEPVAYLTGASKPVCLLAGSEQHVLQAVVSVQRETSHCWLLLFRALLGLRVQRGLG